MADTIGFDRETLMACCDALVRANSVRGTPPFGSMSPAMQLHIKRVVAAVVPILVKAIMHPAAEPVLFVDLPDAEPPRLHAGGWQ